MNEAERKAMEDALRRKRRSEDFEQSLGRSFRQAKLDFDAYIRVVSEIRKRAKADKVPLEEAASSLLPSAQEDQEGKDGQ